MRFPIPSAAALAWRGWRVFAWARAALAPVMGWVALTFPGAVSAQAPLPPWEAMDYGPFLTASIQVPGARTNIAHKGIAIPLSGPDAGAGRESVVFDTDLLRYAGGWRGGFVDLRGIVFDGEHWAYPRAQGEVVFANPAGPGWASGGSFEDPRPQPYGPLPRAWGRWNGLHAHGDRVVLSYEIGGMTVLETPSIVTGGGTRAFARTFNVGRASGVRVLQVAWVDGARGTVLAEEGRAQEGPGILVLEHPEGSGREEGEVTAVAAAGAGRDWSWVDAGAGHARLRMEGPGSGARFQTLVWRGPREALGTFVSLARGAGEAEDLTPLTRGGPRRWDQDLVTTGRVARVEGGFVVEELTAPTDNPWNAWMRFGGLDFLDGGERMAVCTWNGDVWIVDGINDPLRALTWRRIASGLFQPLGLRERDGDLFVLGRDQITRLRDLNGDGETDFYENFNNDALVSEHFHEFATDLKIGPDGDFYYLKCARHALPAIHRQHGTLLRVARDGSRTEIVAGGFRAVNGLGIGPQGQFTTVDNQGHWMPANRINRIEPGGWYGNQWAWNEARRSDYDLPLCWVHNSVDRSGGTHVWAPDGVWGPLGGRMLTLSYGMGRMFLVLEQEARGLRQAAVTPLPVEFETGVMRGVFHPKRPELYACGLFGWAGNKTHPGGFFRIRRNEEPLRVATEALAARDGVVVRFSAPLDPDAASDPSRYVLQAWNYRWSAEYGSPDFRMDGQRGRDTWRVASVSVSGDGRSVFLEVPDIQPVMQWHLAYRVPTRDGALMSSFLHGTFHALDARSGLELLGDAAVTREAGLVARDDLLRPGLAVVFHEGRDGDGSAADARSSRLAALRVGSGEAPSPFVSAGRVRATWEGFLRLPLPLTARFAWEGTGRARLALGGVVVFDGAADSGSRWSSEVSVSGGLTPVVLSYEGPADGAAEMRLLWDPSDGPAEPVPSALLWRRADDARVARGELLREGRRLFAEARCVACHQPDPKLAETGMAELRTDAPSFDGIGERLTEEWMRAWIENPRAIRADARMPKVLQGPTAGEDAADMAAYLATLRTAPTARAHEERAPDGKTGGELFSGLGCVACHVAPGEEGAEIPDRIPLEHASWKWRRGQLEEYLLEPERHYWGTRMPNFHLTRSEAGALAAFLAPGSGQSLKERRDGGRMPNPERGRKLVETAGCLNCHFFPGGPGARAVSSLADLATADWTRGCLAEDAERRGRAPDFAWRQKDREALRAWASEDWVSSLGRDSAAEFAERQVRSLRCLACHERDHEGDALAELEKREVSASGATDGEDGKDAGTAHLGRPSLTHAGEKLRTEWLESFLAGRLPYKPRPDLQGRMPSFPGHAHALAEGLAAQHGYGRDVEKPRPVNQELARVGARLVSVEEGFSCVTCHGVGNAPALAGKDTATVNFSHVADRLRPSYYWRYVQDPVRVMPGTMMPRFLDDDGRTARREILDGDGRRQFEAIWEFLRSLR